MKAEILRGMALLDEKSPGWENEVDLAILDQYHAEWSRSNHCGCVLVHVYGSYYAGLDELGIDAIDADQFGFSHPCFFSNREEVELGYKTLTSWWRRLFRARYGSF